MRAPMQTPFTAARAPYLVFCHVLRVAVVALQKQEAYEGVEAVAADMEERGLQWVVVEQRFVRKNLERCKVRVDAARNKHAVLGHVRQQLFVQHVLPIVQHVGQHVHVSQRRRKELRDRVVV